MTFLDSVLQRGKQHIFAPKYIREKNQAVSNYRRIANQKTIEVEHLQNQLNVASNFLSYAQTGEDRIISFLFDDLGLEKPSYLDIGANFPMHISNTYLFYQKGCQGVCIEPDPDLCSNFRKARPRDICLNIGIGESEADAMPLYIFDEAKGLNTFSKQDADYVQSATRFRVSEVVQIPLRTINSLLEEYFANGLNFLSLDIEGWDYRILRTLDFSKYTIDVVCVETIKFGTRGFREKIDHTVQLMLEKNYLVYADTHINTIFVRKDIYDGR